MDRQRNGPDRSVIDADTRIFLAEGEDGATRIAAGHLAADIARITGTAPAVVTGVPQAGSDASFLLIASAGNARAADFLAAGQVPTDRIAGQWEAYLFRSVGRGLLICGADPLATLRGVYGFARSKLGIDPQILWTGIEPARRERIDLGAVDEVVASPAFRFRGWFLNAGKLIRWNLGAGAIYDVIERFEGMPDSGISGAFGPALAEMVAETCLRMDVNTVIPLSCLNLADPDEKRVADVCAEHGLFLSHHHCEPVGANLRDWRRFWAERGGQVPEMSLFAHPEAFEVWWKRHVEAWSRYPRVVWTLGHRGPGDRPFWNADRLCPDTDEAHGKVISDAMAMQLRLIRQAVGDRAVHCCATLWSDGSSLHAADKLRFPPGTMVLMADHGGKQMMREDFYGTPRRDDLRYGVYYHVCYSPGGPIHTQGNSVDKMWYNLRQLIERGETAMALLNVGPIRPYFPTLAAFTEIATGGVLEPERFLLDWCEQEYGRRAAAEVAECYNMYFEAFVDPFYRGYDGLRGFWDGVMASESAAICKLIWAGDLEAAYARKRHVFPDARTYLMFHRNKSIAMLPAWDGLCRRARRVVGKLHGPARELFIDNVSVQAELNRALCAGLYHVSRAGEAAMANRRRGAVAQLRRAHKELTRGWDCCLQNGNRGIYKDWFLDSPDYGINQRLLQRIDCLIEKLEGRQPASAEQAQRLERLFDPSAHN